MTTIANGFNAAGHKFDAMTFGIEIDYEPTTIERISAGFDKRQSSTYIKHGQVDLLSVLADPAEFVRSMGAGTQLLKQGEDAATLTKSVLTATREYRFTATLEGDRIGGFTKSSMTQGKQALFALSLILAERDEPWPLLIDQPEDDLDSRSVCDHIVRDLTRRKRARQVIMVSHNANLVIGADSEEIIVANRHGDDRPNSSGKTFSYLTGALEFSKPWDPTEKDTLESAGIREHACEILDGGAEAFQKRKEKYRI